VATQRWRSLSRKSELAKAIQYALERWTALMVFVDNGRAEMDNNAAERALRTVPVGLRNYLLAGSNAGGDSAAAIYSLLGSAKLNGIDPDAYMTAVLFAVSPIISSTGSRSYCPGICFPQQRRRSDRNDTQRHLNRNHAQNPESWTRCKVREGLPGIARHRSNRKLASAACDADKQILYLRSARRAMFMATASFPPVGIRRFLDAESHGRFFLVDIRNCLRY
jgi:hypothetical protein